MSVVRIHSEGKPKVAQLVEHLSKSKCKSVRVTYSNYPWITIRFTFEIKWCKSTLLSLVKDTRKNKKKLIGKMQKSVS